MAIRDLTARIRITADTRGVTKGLKRAERSVDNFGSKLVKTAGAVAGGFISARLAVDEFAESAARAGQKVALAAQLEETNQSLDEFLAKLDQVSLGTIATADLIQQSSNALLLGIPADAIVTLLEQARVAAIATGQTISKAFQDITLGVARQSRLILDNLGIIIKVEDANKTLADQLGKTTEQLTSAERQQAFLNEVLRIGEGRIETFGDAASESSLKLARLEKAVRDAIDAIADMATAAAEGEGPIDELFRVATDFFQLISGSETLLDQNIERLGRLGEAFGADAKQADAAVTAIKNLGGSGSAAIDLLTNSSDSSVASLLRLIFNIEEILKLFGLLPDPVDKATDELAKFNQRVDELIAAGVDSHAAIAQTRVEFEGVARAIRLAAEEVENETEKTEENTEAKVENTEATVNAANAAELLAEKAERAALKMDQEREAARLLALQLDELNDTGVITANTFDRIAQTQGIQAAVDAALQSGATTFGRRINLRGGSRLVPVSTLNNNSGVAFVTSGFGGSKLFQPTTIGEFLGPG